MKPYILNLADATADLDSVGGKGLSLARMINAGLPVPGGFHVTTEAYRSFVTSNGIQNRIEWAFTELDSSAGLDALEPVSLAIRLMFSAGEIPPDIVQAIKTACAGLRDVPVAVRSSATAEDLPEASFAGQQETYLNLTGTGEIMEAVRQCWASLWTVRAIAYRFKNRIDQNTVALAVVVQKLVFADAAGILFTANPINGRRGEMVINAAWGLGEAVVSGAVTPDTFTVKKATGKIIHREMANKHIMTVRTPSGTQEIPVPNPKMNAAALTSAQIMELAGLGLKIEDFFGMPMDVEWALAGKRFAILQARPITALPPEWILPDASAIYARGSLAEHIPAPVTPLFSTLGLEIANQATAALWDRMIGEKADFLLVGGSFYKPINGYVYGGMRMRPKDLLISLNMTLRNLDTLQGSQARWQAARAQFAAVVEEWSARTAESLPAGQLLQGVKEVFSAACDYFTRIQLTLPASSTSEILFSALYNSLIRRKSSPQAAVFLLGYDSVALNAEKSLYDLSQWVSGIQSLANYVLNTPTIELVADLQHETTLVGVPSMLSKAWRQRFLTHLETFGQTAYEFDFACPTPAEMPGPLLEAVKGFVSGTARSPYERQREAVEKREEAYQTVLHHTGWPVRGWFMKLLRWAQATAPVREDSIYALGMGHPLIRRMLAEIGRAFVAGGAVEQVEDIYYLERKEVEEGIASLESGAALKKLSEQVVDRKARRQVYLKLNPPLMLPEKTGWMKLMHGGESRQKDGKTVLKGTGTSAGVITAPACVLFGPEDFCKMKAGDVLVAVTTTPAWTPLFSLASAVVTDIGGPLSHSSIVAREYGIPAVMAARSATHIIRSGQRIRVDGAAGTVTLETD